MAINFHQRKEQDNMQKALLVATVYGFLASFEQNNIQILKSLGYEVWCACNARESDERLKKLGVHLIQIPFERNPFHVKNLQAYRKLKKLMEREHFELVHCHTPIGGVLGRLAASSCQVKKVFYTAHGFHFYQGAPIQNWLLYYPIEKWLARKTDVLITINREDYKRAKKYFAAKQVKYVPGVGVDIEEIQQKVKETNWREKRKELQIPEGAVLLLSVGELNKNKNHQVVIEALARIQNSSLHYVICGDGILRQELEALVERRGVSERIHLLGYRKDVIEMMAAADVYVHPSLREGLPVSVMEAMAAGLPCVVSDIRGCRDLIQNGINGIKVKPEDSLGWMCIIRECQKQNFKNIQGKSNKWIQKYNREQVGNRMAKIYHECD